MDELIRYDAIGLTELIRKGEITPAELLETTIQRIEKVNSKLNAVIHKLYDQARTAAESLAVEGMDKKDTVFGGIPLWAAALSMSTR